MKLKRIISIILAILALTAYPQKESAAQQKKKEKGNNATPAPPPAEANLPSEVASEFEYAFVEALKQKQNGNTDAAQQLFARCLEIDSLSAVSLFEMGKLHYMKKDLTSASLLLKRAVRINPKNKWYKITLAQVLQQMGKYAETAQLYDELAKLDKSNSKYLYTEAALWSAAKDYKKALKTYDEFAELTGDHEAAALAKQQVYQQSGNTKGAIKELKKLIKKHPQNTTYYGLLAELYLALGDEQSAKENYDKVFEISPDDGFAYISLAGYYQKKGDKEKSFENFKKAFQSSTLDADNKIQLYLSEVSKEESDSTWTSAQLDELVDILRKQYPDDERMLAVYADHLMRQGKNKEARENIRKFVAKNPTSYDMWWQCMLLSNELEDWQGLFDDTSTALLHLPEEATLYMWKAMAELQLEKTEDAVTTAKKGLEYVGDNTFVKEQLTVFVADANYQLGKVDEAIAAYEEVIKNNPTNYPAMNNYAYYLSEVNRDLNKAESCANKVVQANPTNSTYLDTYAWVLFKKGDYQLAKFYQETAIEHHESPSGLYLEHYGDILFKLGETEKALEQWKKADELGDTSEWLKKKIEQKTYLEE